MLFRRPFPVFWDCWSLPTTQTQLGSVGAVLARARRVGAAARGVMSQPAGDTRAHGGTGAWERPAGSRLNRSARAHAAQTERLVTGSVAGKVL